MKKRLIVLVTVLAVLLLALAACDMFVNKDEVQDLKLVVTAENIGQLEEYPNLKGVDLSGSTCYDAILEYMDRHPTVEVTFTVDMGGTQVSNREPAAVLEPGTFDFDKLVANLRYLTHTGSVHLPRTDLTAAQLKQLKEAAGDVSLLYTVDFAGGEISSNITSLSLGTMTPDQVNDYAEKLSKLLNLTNVDLMDAHGQSKLSIADVKALKAAAPHITFNYTFQLFGKTVSTTDEKIEFINQNIGDEGEQQIRDALSILSGCKLFILDNCDLSNEVLANIRSDFPDTEVVWRIFQTNKNRSWLTNTLVLRAVYGVDDTNSDVFKYCTKVKYLDFGHNEKMHDLSFMSYMPDLEIAILSGSEISDLTPLSGLKKLEFLELGWCGWLKDISPLATCEGLKFLNLSHTKVNNVASLQGLNLEMLHYVNSGNRAGMTESDWAAINAMFPGCWITYQPLKDSNANPYGKGWRYNENNTYTAAYKKVREAFDYDAIDQIINGGGSSNSNTTTNPQPPALTGDAAVKKITKVVTAETIGELEKYVNLEEADLTGSTCYEAIALYMKNHPKVKVTFTVSLGGETAPKNTVTSLTLEQDKYDYATVLANIKYISGLKYLNLPSSTLSAQQLAAIKSACPSVNINYTMKTQGTVLNNTVTAVDLSAMESAQVDSYASQIAACPNVVWVELMSESGTSNLSVADVKKLQQANPNVIFHYTFKLYGKTVSTTDEKVEFKNVSIGNNGEETIRAALDILSGCRYFKLDNCGLSNELLAQIRDDYPKANVVWRIYQTNKNRSWLTDTEVLRAVYGVNDKNSGVFKYCTKVKYMDFGHNTEMVDISFLAYMPDLEIAILSGSPIKDLTPVANCKKLEWLEIAWCGNVKDISPLSQCDSLKYLNLAHARVKDLSPVFGLKLEMLSYVNSGNRSGLTTEYWQSVQEALPNCWLTYNPLKDNEANPYGTGWRYKTSGGYTAAYRKVRDVFNYDEIDKILAGQKK